MTILDVLSYLFEVMKHQLHTATRVQLFILFYFFARKLLEISLFYEADLLCRLSYRVRGWNCRKINILVSMNRDRFQSGMFS